MKEVGMASKNLAGIFSFILVNCGEPFLGGWICLEQGLDF